MGHPKTVQFGVSPLGGGGGGASIDSEPRAPPASPEEPSGGLACGGHSGRGLGYAQDASPQ